MIFDEQSISCPGCGGRSSAQLLMEGFFHSFGRLLKMEEKYYWALSQAKKKQRKIQTEEMS